MFQAFACEEFPEIGKSYLRADFRIECDTTTHTAFMIYAAVMIGICEFARSIFAFVSFFTGHLRPTKSGEYVGSP